MGRGGQTLEGRPAVRAGMGTAEQCDEMLQETLLSEPVHNEELRRQVRAEIQQAPRWSPSRVWLAVGTAAATVLLFVGIRSVYLAGTSDSVSTAGQVSASIWVDAADDHN